MIAGTDGFGCAYQSCCCEKTAKWNQRLFAETTGDLLPTTFFVEFAMARCQYCCKFGELKVLFHSVEAGSYVLPSKDDGMGALDILRELVWDWPENGSTCLGFVVL